MHFNAFALIDENYSLYLIDVIITTLIDKAQWAHQILCKVIANNSKVNNNIHQFEILTENERVNLVNLEWKEWDNSSYWPKCEIISSSFLQQRKSVQDEQQQKVLIIVYVFTR